MSDLTPGTKVFRSTVWRAFALLWLAFVVVIAADYVRRGLDRDSVVPLAWIGLISAMVWCTSWRPLLSYDQEGAEIRNPVRTARLPWNTITKIDATDALRIHADERVVRAWAVPRSGAVSNLARGIRRPAAGAPGGPEGAALLELSRRSPIDYAVEVLRDVWERQRTTTNGRAEVSWAVPEVAVIVALAVIVVVATVTT